MDQVDRLSATRLLSVTAYLAMPTEPDIDAAIAALHRAGHHVLVPRIRGRELDWLRWTPDAEVASGPLGIRELTGQPITEQELEAIDLLLVPGLAVDHDGHRLGQGGGYYDRALGRFARRGDGGPVRTMVLFDDELIDHVPHEPHDQVMDLVLTPERLVSLG